MKKCQPDFFFFPADEPRRKKQKHLYWMDDITLESTLSSCWDLVSYICVNLWCHCREQTLKPQSSWGFPLLPSSTASAHLHRCKTPPMGFSSRQCVPCDGVDNCTKQPSVSYPRPSSTPMVQPSPNLTSTISVSEPQEQLSSPRAMWDPQFAMSSWAQMVWRTVHAMPHVESQSFHPQLLLLRSTEGWKQMGKQWAFTMSCELQSAGQYNHRYLSCSQFYCQAEEAWQPPSIRPLLVDCFLPHWPFYAFLLTSPLCSSSHLCSAKSKPQTAFLILIEFISPDSSLGYLRQIQIFSRVYLRGKLCW